jgi:NAD(P)-dependent dehydrogenase (short-subunit alcohol dehydrogenase family)
MNLSKFSVKNKVAIITGGAGLLGTEFSKCLLENGAHVIILDNNSNKLKICADKLLKQIGLRPNTFNVDITDQIQVKKIINAIYKKFHRIDILINNAALNPVPGSQDSLNQFKPYESYPIDLWKKEIDVGLTGTLIMTQAVSSLMMKNKNCSIINISSIYGLLAPDNRIYGKNKYKSIAYTTAKSGILNLTKTWAAHLAPYKVRVNTLTLGGISNNQDKKFIAKYNKKTVLNRMAEKDDFNGAILLLSSDASSYITGSNLVIDGGWSIW